MRRQFITSLLIGFVLLAFIAGTLVQSASAAPAEPLERTPVMGTATAIAATATAQAAFNASVGSIGLTVTGVPATAWTVVQWQDGFGGWHDVSGWRGDLDAGQKVWWVLPGNFGQGPFRWVVYEKRDGKVWATSASFTLPRYAGDLVRVTVGAKTP